MGLKNVLKKFLPQRTEFVAIDIGKRYIRAVEVSIVDKQPVILNAGCISTPKEFIEGSWDKEELVEVLAELAEQTGIRNREVISTLGGEKTIIRLVRVPSMSARDLEKAVIYEAKNSIPIPVEDLIVRHLVLNEVENLEGKQLNLLLAAATKDIIYRYCDLFAQAGMFIRALDLEILALYRVFYSQLMSEPESGESGPGVSAVIDIGAATTNLIVVKGGVILFSRTLGLGGDLLTNSMAEMYGISFEEAQELKETKGKILSAEEAASVFSPEEMQIDISLREGLGELVHEVRQTLDFFQTQPGGEQVKRVILSGGTTKLQGFVSFMQEALEMPVELGILPVKAEEIDGENKVDLSFAVALGLALRDYKQI